MDTQVLDLIKIIVGGLFGAVITPLVTEVLIPFIKNREVDPNKKPGKQKSKPTKPSSKSRIRLLAGIGLVIFGLVAIFLIKPTFLSSCPIWAATSVPITSPAEGSKVPPSTIVRGTACHIPSDKELWLLVVAEGITGYYPQNGPIGVSSDGTWSESTFIGSLCSACVGKNFVLHTALADHEGGATLQRYINSGQASGKFPPIPLPAGIELISQIQVVRGR